MCRGVIFSAKSLKSQHIVFDGKIPHRSGKGQLPALETARPNSQHPMVHLRGEEENPQEVSGFSSVQFPRCPGFGGRFVVVAVVASMPSNTHLGSSLYARTVGDISITLERTHDRQLEHVCLCQV